MKKDVYPDVRIEIISEGLTKKILGKTNGAAPVVYGEEQFEGKNLPNVEIKGKNKELQALLETSNKKPNYTGLVKEALLELRKAPGDDPMADRAAEVERDRRVKEQGLEQPSINRFFPDTKEPTPPPAGSGIGDTAGTFDPTSSPGLQDREGALAGIRAQQQSEAQAEADVKAKEAASTGQRAETQRQIDSGEVLSRSTYDPNTGISTYGDARTGEMQTYSPFEEGKTKILPTGEPEKVKQPDVDMPPTGVTPGVTYTSDGKEYNELGFEVGKPLTFENMDPNSALLRNFQGNQAMVQDFLNTGGADNKPLSAKEIREMLGIENAVQGLVKAAMFELKKQAPMMGGAAGQLPKTTSMTKPPNMGVNQQQPVIQGAGNMQLAREQKEPAERAEKPQVRPRTKLRPTALKTPTQDK